MVALSYTDTSITESIESGFFVGGTVSKNPISLARVENSNELAGIMCAGSTIWDSDR